MLKQMPMSFLKTYLRLHEKLHPRTIGIYGPKMFGGLHPKNVFHYRSEFFIENVERDDVVIDLACGTGLILNNISPYIARGFGIEQNPKNLALCRTKHKKANLEFIESDILLADYSALRSRTKYTTAIFSHILEHIENPVDLLKKVSAPKVLVCVPSQENWYRQLLKHLNLPYKTDPTHFREYTREMLKQELREAGYKIEYIGFNSEGEIIGRAENT